MWFQSSYVSWHWRMMQNDEGKLICRLKKHLRNLVNFHASRRMPENLHFDQMFLSKAYKDLAEKVQKSWSHDTQEWCKVWRKTDSWFQKWHENLGEFYSASSSRSLKIFTLKGYFCRNYVMFKLKKFRGVVSWKMTYGFKNDISHLVNSHTSSWK